MNHSHLINKLAVIFLAGLALSGILSCKSTSNPVAPAYVTGQYWPFVIGNQWKYSFYNTDTNGVMVAGSDMQITMTVTDSIAKNGISGWSLQILSTGKHADSSVSYAAYTAIGDFMKFQDTSYGYGRGKWSMGLPFSMLNTGGTSTINDTTVTISGGGSDGTVIYDTSRTIENILTSATGNASVTVAAGIFQTEHFTQTSTRAYRYTSSAGYGDTSTSVGVTHFYCKSKVGVVKIVQDANVDYTAYASSKSGGGVQELISYTVH